MSRDLQDLSNLPGRVEEAATPTSGSEKKETHGNLLFGGHVISCVKYCKIQCSKLSIYFEHTTGVEGQDRAPGVFTVCKCLYNV